MTIQRRVFVSGRVQGVGFRAATARAASQFSKVRGFVRNLADGRVEVLLLGPAEDVLAMVSWCTQGPAQARVSRIEVLEEPVGTRSSGTGDDVGPGFDILD